MTARPFETICLPRELPGSERYPGQSVEDAYREFIRGARVLLTKEQWAGFIASIEVQGKADGLAPELIAELQEDCRRES